MVQCAIKQQRGAKKLAKKLAGMFFLNFSNEI